MKGRSGEGRMPRRLDQLTTLNLRRQGRSPALQGTTPTAAGAEPCPPAIIRADNQQPTILRVLCVLGGEPIQSLSIQIDSFLCSLCSLWLIRGSGHRTSDFGELSRVAQAPILRGGVVLWRPFFCDMGNRLSRITLKNGIGNPDVFVQRLPAKCAPTDTQGNFRQGCQGRAGQTRVIGDRKGVGRAIRELQTNPSVVNLDGNRNVLWFMLVHEISSTRST